MKKIVTGILMLLLLIPSALAEEWIEISDVEGLRAIADQPDANYRLVSDIDLGGIEWKPITFNGNLDGNGHAILNMTVREPGDTVFKTKDGNKIKYKTVGAGLFDCSLGCAVKNLTILGADIDITTDQNCFCGILIGGAQKIKVADCEFSGRVQLHQSGKNSGVSGVIGFASGGSITGCKIDAELVLVDTNRKEPMEEFGAGVLACGHMDIEKNAVIVDMYTSVHGYCHNGGLIGMLSKAFSSTAYSNVTNNKIKCRITFFEDTYDRRAYAAYDIGEELNGGLNKSNNKRAGFSRRETKNYKVDLYPCTCDAEPVEEVIEATATDYGYTLHTCPTCGHKYKDHYTMPVT